ncbi:MAG TPA: CotS family spore coat protein [Bacilli bacterium]|nr:CotS family spore coat protein [Bacilli bacterium]
MAEWLIEPWGDVEGDVPTVPPEIDALAVHVMNQYDMTVSSMQLITTKPDKGGAIWRIDTNHGPRSLKVLHRTPARSLFSVGAQEYLVGQGARVPALVRTKQGDLSFVAGGKMWIVTDWIDELTPATKIDLEGAQALCYGLGEFHRISRGYLPPEGADWASRLHNYPRSYQKVIDKMEWFRHIAELYIDRPASPRILSMIDKYQQQARDTLAALEASPYYELAARGETYWGLAHQDYGWSNGQLGPGGLWVIDLDGVSYDLPIRDLRKLITGTMHDMGTWDITWMKGMIEAYHQANPIEPEMMQVFLIDMMLPNEFYKNVKEMVYQPELFLNAETDAMVERIDRTDASKWPALQELGALDLKTYENKPMYQLNIDTLRENVNKSRWDTQPYAPSAKAPLSGSSRPSIGSGANMTEQRDSSLSWDASSRMEKDTSSTRSNRSSRKVSATKPTITHEKAATRTEKASTRTSSSSRKKRRREDRTAYASSTASQPKPTLQRTKLAPTSSTSSSKKVAKKRSASAGSSRSRTSVRVKTSNAESKPTIIHGKGRI